MAVLHVWEKFEITLQAQNDYGNPYTEVDVWVDLQGPNFHKRVYGFWDGDDRFIVRCVAEAPGLWKWTSGCNSNDPGLAGKTGEIEAIPWTEEEKQENLCRRGFIRATPNGHAFELADGTSFYYLADTWWATPTYRFPWFDDEQERALGPDMGFKDMLRYRKQQGYNGIAMLAGHPAWASDGFPPTIVMDDEKKTSIRQAWQSTGSADSNTGNTTQAKDMHNEGGRPFLFPGKVPGYESVVPNFDLINPDYFRYMDRKVDYLNAQGMIPFIEAARRDISQAWKNYYDWPKSYARYIHYIFCRYQANNTLLSPIHFDFAGYSIPSREYNEPANLVIDRWGPPPFGTLLGTNAAPSTLANFGGPDEARWLTFHQTGNWREHDHYWYLTEIYHAQPPRPAFNGEPYYPGFPDNNPEAHTEEAALNCRSGMYGSFLSGGFAGYIYGAEGIWGGNIEAEANYRIWDALAFQSGDQVRHLGSFVTKYGTRYQDLIPNADLVIPNKSGPPLGYRGWAYCAHTPDKTLLLLYLEKDCPAVTVRSLIHDATYTVTWFDPRSGEWSDGGTITAGQEGRVSLPTPPTPEDWALSLQLKENS